MAMSLRHLPQTLFGLAAVVAFFFWFSAGSIPGWLWVVMIAFALPAGIQAGLKEKRMSRQMMREWWRTVARGVR